MRGFVIGFLISTALVFGIVYTMVINPSLFINLIGVDGDQEITFIENANEEHPPEETIDPSYQDQIDKGDTLFESDHYALAAIEYQFATEVSPHSEQAFYKLAEAYFYDENYVAAEENLLIALELNPNNTEGQILFGENLIKLGKFKEAKAQFESINEDEVDALYYIGILSAYFGDYENAESYFQKTIENGKSAERSKASNNFLNGMAEFYLADDAPETYKKTLISRSLAETEETVLAINLLYEVLAEEPDYRDAWIILGFVYLTLEQYGEAQDALLKAVELDPTKGETRYFLGMSYFGQDEMDSAMTQFELALESGYEPKVQVYQKLGDAAIIATDYEKAASAYENVLTLNSSDVDLYIRPIWLYLDHLDNAARALELSEQAIAEHPNSAMSYNLLGWTQTVIGEFELAEQNLNYALILDPDLAAAHLNFGRWYEAQGQFEQAKESYKRAYTLDAGGSVGNLAAEQYNQLIQQEETAETAESEIL